MPFIEGIGTIACRCVLENGEPVLFVSHAGNDWQMYCRAENHDFNDSAAMERDLVLVHIKHLVSRDPTLDELSDLPVDMGAARTPISTPWITFEDADD